VDVGGRKNVPEGGALYPTPVAREIRRGRWEVTAFRRGVERSGGEALVAELVDSVMCTSVGDWSGDEDVYVDEEEEKEEE
jgi:hypothetical protein